MNLAFFRICLDIHTMSNHFECYDRPADLVILNKKTPPPPFLSPFLFPSTLMEFCHSITRVTVSHCLAIAFLGIVVSTGSAG